MKASKSLQKKRYEVVKDIKKRIDTQKTVSFSERNIVNIYNKKKRKIAKEEEFDDVSSNFLTKSQLLKIK